jgi:hypothetical protein
MLTVITTTHAIPQQLPSARAALRTVVVVCPYCLESLGSVSPLEDRKSIEAKHKCREKLLARQPAISVPFS